MHLVLSNLILALVGPHSMNFGMLWLLSFFFLGPNSFYILETSLTHGLFSSMLYIFHIFRYFLIFLLLVSNLIPLWSENILCMISLIQHLLKFMLMI